MLPAADVVAALILIAGVVPPEDTIGAVPVTLVTPLVDTVCHFTELSSPESQTKYLEIPVPSDTLSNLSVFSTSVYVLLNNNLFCPAAVKPNIPLPLRYIPVSVSLPKEY